MEIKTILIISLIPIISALIGWFTNYLAIKSLFKPKKKIKILFFTFQGVIPKRRKVLIKRIAAVVEEYMFSSEDIEKSFKNKKNLNKIKKTAIPIIENKIIEKIPIMFQGVAKPIISKVLEEDFDEILLKLSNEIATNTISSIDIKKIVETKLLEYDIENVEKIIYSIAKKELKHIEFLGAVIGFIIGLFQIGVIFLI